MQLEDAKRAMTEELYQWGWWAQLCESKKVQYYSQQPFDKERPRPWKISDSSSLTITDDRARQIDACVAIFDEETRQIMRYRFVNGANYRLIAEWMEKLNKDINDYSVNKDRIARIIDNCVSYIAGNIGYKGAA